MMWLIQYIVYLAEAADLAVKTITWMPTQAGVNFNFALLCLAAAIFDVSPRRVMALSALLYLILCMI
jgi:hypothetical protein